MRVPVTADALSAGPDAIRPAQLADIDSVKTLADGDRSSFGFLPRSCFVQSAHRGELYVAVRDGRVVGFARLRHRCDAATVLYEVCVNEADRGKGIGAKLVCGVLDDAAALGQREFLLKAPVSTSADRFYSSLGFCVRAQEAGKERPLNVWCRSLRT